MWLFFLDFRSAHVTRDQNGTFCRMKIDKLLSDFTRRPTVGICSVQYGRIVGIEEYSLKWRLTWFYTTGYMKRKVPWPIDNEISLYVINV